MEDLVLDQTTAAVQKTGMAGGVERGWWHTISTSNINNYVLKDVGHFWLCYIRNNTKSWDTILTLRGSRIAFTGPIYLI